MSSLDSKYNIKYIVKDCVGKYVSATAQTNLITNKLKHSESKVNTIEGNIEKFLNAILNEMMEAA